MIDPSNAAGPPASAHPAGRLGPYAVAGWIAAVLAGMLLGIAVVLMPLPAGAPLLGDAALPLRVGYAVEPPYASLDAGGLVQGESPEILRALRERAGLPEPVWVHVEFGQLIHELRIGRIDLIAAGLFITPQRAGQVAFSRPTARVTTALLVAPNNPLGLHSLADLVARPGARLAVLRGAVEAGMAAQAGIASADLLALPDVPSAMTAVRSGRAQGFLLSAPSLRAALQGTGAPGGELATPFEPPRLDGQAAIGLPAFAMRHGDARLARLDAALAGYLGSAEHRQLATRLGFMADELPPPQSQPAGAPGGRAASHAGAGASGVGL